MKSKRVLVATLSGVLFGLVCYRLASSGPAGLVWPVAIQIILSRTLIGFTIGVSRLRMPWSVHGLLIGMVYSLPLSFSGLMAPESPDYSKSGIFVFTIVLGMIYGLLIELITTKFFKCRMEG